MYHRDREQHACGRSALTATRADRIVRTDISSHTDADHSAHAEARTDRNPDSDADADTASAATRSAARRAGDLADDRADRRSQPAPRADACAFVLAR